MATCQHCGYQSEGLDTCPLCGTEANKEQNRGGPKESVSGPSWEDETEAFPQNLLDTWRRSMLEPSLFFRWAAHKEPVGRALLYFVIIIIITALFDLFWQLLLPVPEAANGMFSGRGLLRFLQTDQTPAVAVLNFFLAPFAAAVGLLLWGSLLHLSLLVFHKERQGFKATLRIASYAAGPSVLAAVPVAGSVVGGVWSLVLTVIGIREVHRMSTSKAVLSVLLALVVPIFITIAAIAMFVATVASAIT